MKCKYFIYFISSVSYGLLTFLATAQMAAYSQSSMLPENNAELRALFDGEWKEQFNTWGRWGGR